MAMRSQIYEWTNLAPGGTGSTLFRRSTDLPVAVAVNNESSVFIGGIGYNITKPAETTATQFVVIEDVALTPDGLDDSGGLAVGALVTAFSVTAGTDGTYTSVGQASTSGSGTGAKFTMTVAGDTLTSVLITTGGSGYATGDTITTATEQIGGGSAAVVLTLADDEICVALNGGCAQIRINTTDYFQNPDVTDQCGIPGLSSPYPRGISSGTDNILKTFDLYPDIYVLPGQVWDVLYTQGNIPLDSGVTCDCVAVFIKYTLYDGPDALIANKLLELGITVNPNNVDWYKRTLIEQQSAATVVAATA